MWQIIKKSLWLLLFVVVICCVIYPAALWVVGQTLFPFKANGSMVKGPDGAVVGSRLIAQPFTKDEYFQPRPSACAYDASASSSSSLAASNCALRGRVAAALGPIVKYQGGAKDGQLVAPDIEAWSKSKGIQPVKEGSDIQATSFDLWRQEHSDVALQDVPGDLVTTSGSGLDPHISLQDAEFQLDRVASKWAADLKRDPAEVRKEIESLLTAHASAPLDGLAGEPFVNVLEINLLLREKYGTPAS